MGAIIRDRLQELHQEVGNKKDDGFEQLKRYARNNQNTFHSLL
jgi:hypothetical protein